MNRLTILLLSLLLGCQPAARSRSIRLAHGLPLAHPVHQAMLFMADTLAELSGGRLRLAIYPAEQLGTERQCIELLQIGALGMTKVSGAVMENFNPEMRLLSLPFLFRSREHAFEVFDGPLGRRLLEGSRRQFLVGLCYYDAGSRSFYARKPIHSPADLAGLKVRVQESPSAIRMVNDLGAKATPIAWGELYSALQQGVVDAAENNLPSFQQSKHYEVCRYYSMDEHTRVPDLLLMSTHVWDRLDAQERAWLQAAAAASARRQRQLWAEAEAEALREIEAAGVAVLRPDPAPFARQLAAYLADSRRDSLLGPLLRSLEDSLPPLLR